MRVKEEFCLAARVVVVKQACIDAEVAERLLVAAIEIHLQIAACITRVFGYVGVPVARVEAARIGVIKASLKRRLAECLRNPAEPVVRDQRDVSRQRRGGWLLSGRE